MSYQFDVLNRLTNAVDGRLTGTQNTAYRFDSVGNLQALAYPNGITNLYQYNSLNRLTNLSWKLNGSQRGDFAYKLGWAGNRTNLADNVNGTSRTFNDVAHQVIGWHGRGRVDYIRFPHDLTAAYQAFTEADVTRLRAAGFTHDFTPIEIGVRATLDAIAPSPLA